MDLQTLNIQLENVISEISSQLITIRRHLHQYPELGSEEKETTSYISNILRSSDLKIVRDQNKTGLWADLFPLPRTPLLAIRGDIDALPIQEKNAIDYASKHPGIMHACGHDVHTTILLGTAMVLSRLREFLKVNVRFLFQPAEEITPGGAIEMIERGALKQVSAILALHVNPGLPVGHVGIKFGSFLASNDIFKIKVIGKGGHAAHPHEAIDPIFVTSQLINTLYQSINRNTSPFSPTVLTVTKISGGSTGNIIPGEVDILGTLRCLDNNVRESMWQRIKVIIDSVCELHHAKNEFTIIKGAPPLVNDLDLSQLFYQSAIESLGEDRVIKFEEPDMGSEDFSWYLQHVPGVMFCLGTNGCPGTDFKLHHPNFNIDEQAISIGVKMLSWAAIKYSTEHSN